MLNLISALFPELLKDFSAYMSITSGLEVGLLIQEVVHPSSRTFFCSLDKDFVHFKLTVNVLVALEWLFPGSILKRLSKLGQLRKTSCCSPKGVEFYYS